MKSKFLLLALLLVALLVVMEFLFPKPVSWNITLSSDDKIPYGTYILKESISSMFPEKIPGISRLSFYEIKDSMQAHASNYFVLAKELEYGKDELKSMLEIVERGSNILIASYGFGGVFKDSLGVKTKDLILERFSETGNPLEEDSSYIKTNLPGNWLNPFYYKRRDVPVSFNFDSADGWRIHAWSEEEVPVLISRQFGKGNLILSSTPLVFTNYYLLKEGNVKMASAILSMMTPSDLHWTEFYSRGRPEPQTPMRYILTTPSLAWAYYLLITVIFIYIFFEAKRKQRPIPIIEPPRNDSLDFVKTVGNLYFERGDHKNIALKKINYLLEYIRTQYHLSTNQITDDFLDQLSKKSGKPSINVEGLFTMIEILNKKGTIDSEELITLNKKIDAFLQKE